MTLPRIRSVETIWIRNPFRPEIAPWLRLNNAGWEFLEITQVQTDDRDCGGVGETLVYYTGETTTEETAEFAVGRTVPELLRRGGALGVGLRLALYDSLGKSLGLPVHALFSRTQVRDRVPVAWWSTKLPPELLAAEAATASAAGYTHHKVKARPWFDVREQLDQVAAVVPPGYRVELDWNSMLVNAGHALPVLEEVQRHPIVSLVESPIDRADLIGQARLRGAMTVPLVEHYDEALAPVWLQRDALDGFVLDPSLPERVFRQADTIDTFAKDAFLQMCGTAITTAWVAQLGAILPAARLPHVTSSNIYRDEVIESPPTVQAGHLAVTDAPGLGIRLDHEAVERLRVPHGSTPPERRVLLDFSLADGFSRSYSSAQGLWRDSTVNATFPVQPHGARLAIREDDGSAEFERDHRRAQRSPAERMT